MILHSQKSENFPNGRYITPEVSFRSSPHPFLSPVGIVEIVPTGRRRLPRVHTAGISARQKAAPRHHGRRSASKRRLLRWRPTSKVTWQRRRRRLLRPQVVVVVVIIVQRDYVAVVGFCHRRRIPPHRPAVCVRWRKGSTAGGAQRLATTATPPPWRPLGFQQLHLS